MDYLNHFIYVKRQFLQLLFLSFLASVVAPSLLCGSIFSSENRASFLADEACNL